MVEDQVGTDVRELRELRVESKQYTQVGTYNIHLEEEKDGIARGILNDTHSLW